MTTESNLPEHQLSTGRLLCTDVSAPCAAPPQKAGSARSGTGANDDQ